MSDAELESIEKAAEDSASEPSTTERVANELSPLRVWPAVVLLVLMAIARFVPPTIEDAPLILMMVAVIGPVVLGALILLWWLTFSRASLKERLVGFFGALLIALGCILSLDKTMIGPGIMMVTVPLGTAAFGIGAVLLSRWLSFNRTIVALLLALCGFGYSTLLRSEGMWGHFALDLHWRWEPTAEELMLADRADAPTSDAAISSDAEMDEWLADPQWTQFRGPGRVSQQHGPAIQTDWLTNKPELIWKIPVGPGWSSFAVAGNLLFTQEQRGEQETVVCYTADEGIEVWSQEIESRFFDPLGGPGPRATPTLFDGSVFVQGASGQLQRLDAKTGESIWEVDVREVADREPPVWGFSSSPLVVGSAVIVHAGGEDDKGTLAFEIESGELKWSTAAGDHSYSSPQLLNLFGEDYVVMFTNAGMNILDPESGESRCDFEWKLEGYSAVQPQVIAGNSIVLASQQETRCLDLTQTADGFEVEERWASRKLKPDFNDFVIHDGYAYGFDAEIFACVDLETGQREWKRGRYGKGQVLMLADSGVLLVIGERGELILLAANPSKHEELASFEALDGKTWNHPVVIGDRLYVRNSQEAACYRLPVENESENPDDLAGQSAAPL
ncbi:outer membrane protein assembly factor BamB family protein [Rhodopirellula bahusiensis]|uniref:Alcohol dehydrogenase n=1 Tax=Rhodopirellula bahusiensis TaxID=2014065 RepID=A0A2G1W309_9BACT|nr:PQQ-binding-like beta-propeller repeat protein [Rhodopirellula bahusiensis]PHQ33250.1 alcohol dehydrogenase [Rhodopirellula bahusiensis]